MSARKKPPLLPALLDHAVHGTGKPVAIVLAGHNGSGKATLWRERLEEQMQVPLVNADRLTASILPKVVGEFRRSTTATKQHRKRAG